MMAITTMMAIIIMMLMTVVNNQWQRMAVPLDKDKIKVDHGIS